MKKLLLSIISFAVCQTISGQQISQSNNRYRGNDALEKKQVTVIGFDLNSKNSVWNLEDAELSKATFQAEYTTEMDTLMAIERGSRTYYHQDGSAVSIIGSENVQELISYDMPETWLRFPMHVGDSVCGYFNGTGKYCDKLFMRRFGTYKTKADAIGKMVLPDGDTLRNVTRLHTERYVGTVMAPIDTMEFRIPAFTTDSIIKHLAADTIQFREDVYRWYAEGYRYPVLEAMTLSRGKEKLTEEMFYCPPDIQEQLVLDEENKQTRERLMAENTRGSDSGPADGDKDRKDGPGGFAYHISQNEGAKTVTVSYSSEQPVRVIALLANSLGYVYRRAEQTDGSSVTFGYGNLNPGQYILYITAFNKKYAEKFNVK